MTTLLSSVPVLLLLGAILIPAVVYAVLGVGEKVIDGFLPTRIKSSIRPWFWLFIPLALAALVLVYPAVDTIVASFQNRDGSAWVGFQNFVWALGPRARDVLGTNLIWLVVFPLGTLVLAVIAAVLFDRVRYERLAMTLIILPTAISFAASSVIWQEVYQYAQAGATQTGLLNALWTLIPGTKPVPWLQVPLLNTFCLIFVAVWSGLGVATLIISAAVKGVPAELVEAARLDGAGELRIFFTVTLQHISSSLLVVITTEVIFALKIFDIVYVMTAGNFGTDTFAHLMYTELFGQQDLGRASAIAVVLLVVALPVVIINIRQFRKEEAR